MSIRSVPAATLSGGRTRLKFSHRVAVAAAGAAAVVLAGCSGSGNQAGPAATGSASASANVTSQLSAASGDIGTLTWDLPEGEPTSLDPVFAGEYSSTMLVSNLCDPLLRMNPNFSESPNLASYSYRNSTTLVFTIRPGIKFWDGSAVTADDVAFSLKRMENPNGVAGAIFSYVKSIAVTGPMQVTVTFKQSDALFVQEMATEVGDVVEQKYTESEGSKFGTAAGGIMCSGPYELKSWQAGQSITLTRNDSYWNPAFKAHAKTVTIQFITDSSTLAQGLMSGEIDGAYEVPPTIIPQLEKSSAGTVTFGPSTQSYSLNIAHPGGVIGSVDLRKALILALDRPALVSAVFHGSATTNPAEVTVTNAYSGISLSKANAYDPAAAEKLVKSSGYAGQTITLATLAGDQTQSELAQLVQQQAKIIGVNVSIDALQPLTYTQMTYDATARKGIDIMLLSAYSQVTDPLELMIYALQPDGPYNYTGFADKQAQTDLALARQTLHSAVRTRLIQQILATYGASYSITNLVQNYEVSYLAKSLTGATTSLAYMFRPSLALIGTK